MSTHIKAKPVILTGNGTTHVEATLPADATWNNDGVEIFNSDLTQHCFAIVGNSTEAVATVSMQPIPAGQVKRFRRDKDATTVSIVFPGAGTAKVYATSCSGFDTIS